MRRIGTILVVVTALSMTGVAQARGLFDDLNANMGREIEKAAQDTGAAVEKAARDTGHAIEKGGFDAKSLVHDLTSKPEDELLSFSLSPDMCAEIDCHGVPSDIAQRAVSVVLAQKQNIVDLEV